MHDRRTATLTLRARLCASTFVAGLALNPAGALPPTPNAVLTNVGGTAPTIVTSGNTQNVTLNAARTLLRYGNGYQVNSNETVNFRFAERSDIAIIHNTASDVPINIDGALNAFVGTVTGGNVWLLSSAGIMFGKNARVDVGGLIASTAIPSNLSASSGGALDPLTLNFQFDQQGIGDIRIDAGAMIRAAGGTLAFIAPQISSAAGASITGANGASVLYGAVHNARIKFVRTASNDLDLIDFEVPNKGQAQSGASLDLGGDTNAGNIYLAAVSRSAVFGSVINATGTLTANSAANVNGDIVLSAGGGIIDRAPVRAPDGNFRINAELGAVNAAGALVADVTGNLTLGDTVNTGGTILVTAAAITSEALTAGRDIILRAGDTLGSTSQDFGDSNAGPYGPGGGDIILNGKAIAGDDIVLEGLFGGISTGSITLTGLGGDAAGDPLGQLDTAGDGNRLSLTAPGAVTLGRAFSNDMLVGGSALAIAAGTDVQIDLIGDVRLDSVTAGSGAITINAGVTQSVNGPAPESNVRVGSLSARYGIKVAASGAATIDTADITQSGDVSLSITAAGGINLGSGAANYIDLSSQAASIKVGTLIGDSIDVRAAIDVEIGTLAFDFDPQGFGSRAGQINSGGDIRLGLGTGSIGTPNALGLSAGGAVTVDVLGDAAISFLSGSGGSIVADTVATGAIESRGSFAVTARAGDILLGTSRVDGDFTVTATGGNAGLGDARIAGALALTGDTVSLLRVAGLDGNVGTPLASIAITTTVGGLTLGTVPLNALGGLRISSAGDLTVNAAPAGYGYGSAPQSLAAGGDVSLSSAALLRIANGAGIASGRDLILVGQSIDTGPQTLAAARDVQVTAVADARLGRITATRDLLVNVTAGGFTTTNDLTTQTGLISLKATGDVFLIGASAATDLITDIAGGLQLGDGVSMSASRDLLLKAGSIDAGFGAMAAGHDAQLRAGDIALGSLSALGNITVTADTLAYAAVTAQGSGLFDATVTDIFDTRGTLNAGSIRIRGATLANEDASGSMTAATGIDVSVTGAARLGNLDGGSGGVSVGAGGALGIFGENRGTTLAYASTGGSISLADSHVTTSGAITLDALAGGIDTRDAGLIAVTDINANAGTGLATGSLDAGGNGRFATKAGDAALANSRIAGDLSIRALAGKAGLGNARVGGSLVLEGATISGASLEGFASPTAPLANINIRANAGGYGLSGFALRASGDVSVSVRDDLALKSVGAISAGRDVLLYSEGLLTIDTGLTVGRDLLLAGGRVTTLGQSLASARDVVIGGTDTVQLGDIAAGRNLVIFGRDINASGAALTTGDAAILSAGALDLGTLATGGNVRIETGNLRYAGITARGSGTITVNASGTIDTSGALTADSIGLTAATLASSTTSGSMTARQGITVDASTTAMLGNLDGGTGTVAVTSGGTLGLFGSNSGSVLRYTSTAGDIILGGSHNATTGSLTATALAGQIDSGSASLAAASDIILRAASATLGNITAGGAIDIDIAGALTLAVDRSLGAGGGIGVFAQGIAGSGATLATTGGDIRLTSRSGSLQIGSLDASRDISLSSTGALAAASLTAARDISVGGGDVSIASLDSGGSTRLTINGTKGVLGAALTGGDLVVSGGNGFAIALGALDIGGNFGLTTSGAVTYAADGRARGGNPVNLDVGGSITLDIGSYDAGNVSLIAGGDITLTSAGAVTLAAANAGDDARISGGALAIDTVTAGRPGSMDGEGDGFNILLSGTTLASRSLVAGTDVATRINGESRLGDFTCSGICRASSVRAGRDIDLSSGLVSLAPAASPLITAGRDLIIHQTGAGADLVLPTALTSGRGVTLASDGGLALGGLNVPGPVTLAARFIQIDQLVAGGTTTLTAGRIRIGELNTGTAAQPANATLIANGIGSSGTVQIIQATVFGDLTLSSANGNAGLEGGAVAGTLSLTGATAALGPVTGVNAKPFVQQLSIRTTSGGFIGKSALGATTDIALDIAGDAELAGVTAGGRLTALVGGQLRLDVQPLSAGGQIDISAASILAGSSQIGAGSTINIGSSGDATLGNVTAGSNLTITSGGTVRFGGGGLGVLDGGLAAGGRVAISAASIAGGNGDINAGEDIRLSATGSIAVDTLSAGDDLILESPDTRLIRGTARGNGPDSEGDGGSIRLLGGAASAYFLDAQNDIVAGLSGKLALGNADCRGPLPCDVGNVTAGGTVRLRAGDFAFAEGFATQGVFRAGTDIMLSGFADMRFAGGFSAGRDIVIITGIGGLALGDIAAPNNLQLYGQGGVTAGVLHAGGNIDIAGDRHTIVSSDAGGSTQLTSHADSRIGTVRSRNGLTVTSSDGVTIGDISVGGAIRIDIGNGSAGAVRGWQDGSTLAPVQTLTVSTQRGSFRMGAGDISGDARFDITGSLTLSTLSVGGTTIARTNDGLTADLVRSRAGLDVNAGSFVVVDEANIGGNLLVTATSVRLGRVQGWQDGGVGYGATIAPLQTLGVTTTAGDLVLGDSDIAGTATLSSFGRLTLARLMVAGSVDLRSGGNLEGGAITGSSVTIGSSGAVTSSSVTASGDLQIAADSIAVGRLAATNGTVNATAKWRLAAEAVMAGGDVILSGTVLSTAGLDAGRDLILTATAGDIAASGLVAVRDLMLTASGNINGSDVGAGGSATLRAGGGIDLANLATGGNAVLLASSGGITLAGARIGGDLDIGADAGRADLTGLGVGNDLFVRAGAIDTVRVGGTANRSAQQLPQTRDIRITALDGGIVDADLTATRDISITSAGAVAVTRAAAGQDIGISGAGGVTIGAATAQRDLLVTAAGDVGVGDALVGRDLTLSGALVGLASLGPVMTDGGPLLTRDISLVSTAAAPGITALDVAGTLIASGNIRLDYASRIAVGGLQAGGAIGITAPAANIGATSAGGTVTLTGGSFSMAGVSAGSDLIITVADLRGNSFSAGDDVDAVVKRASVGRITSTGLGPDNDRSGALLGSNIRISGNALTIGTLAAANDLLVNVTVAQLCCDVPGQLFVAGPVQAGRDVQLTADAISLNGGSAGRDFVATANAGLASTGALAVGRDAVLGGNGVTLARLTTGGDARLTSGAGVIVTGSAIGNDLAVTAETGRVSLTGVGVGRDLLVRAGQIDQLTLAGQAPPRDIILTSLASGVALGDLMVSRDLIVTAAGAIQTGTLTAGRDITARGIGITTGSAGAGHDLSFDAGAGALTAGNLAGGDDVRLLGGAVSVGRVDTRASAPDDEGDGSVISIAGSSIATGDLDSGRDVVVRTTGALGVGSVRAGRDVTLSGQSLSSGAQIQGRIVTMTATGGALSGGSVTASGDLNLDAATTLTLTGLARATGAVTLNAAALAIANADAGTRLALTARNGDLVGSAWRAGGDAVARANGALQYGTLNAEGRAILSGASISGGDVTAGSADIAATAGVTLGIANSTGDFAIRGSSIAATSLNAGQDARLSGSGAISVAGPIRAGRDLLAGTDSGSLTTSGALDAGRDIRLAADGISVGAASAKGRMVADARSGDLRMDNVDAGAGIDLTGASVTGGTLVSRGNATVTTAGQVRIATASAAGDFAITAAGIDAGALSAGQDVRLTGTAPILVNGEIGAGRDLFVSTSSGSAGTTGALTAGRDIRVSGDGVSIGAASAGAALVADARGGVLVLGDVTAVGLVDLKGDSVTIGALTAGANAGIIARNAVKLGTARAAGDFAITAGSITAAALSAGQDVLLAGTAPISIDGQIDAAREIQVATSSGSATTRGALTAGRDILVSGEGVGVGAATAGGAIRIAAGRAALRIDDSRAGGLIDLSGASVSGGALAAGSDATISASGAVTLGTASAARDFAITAASIGAGALSAGQDVRLTGTAPIAIDGRISASRDIAITTSNGSATATGALTAGRNIAVTASGVSIGDASAGASLIADAGAGALRLGNGQAGGAASLAGQSVTGGTLAVGTTASVTATNAVTLGTARAGGDFAITAASIGAGALSAGQDVRLTGTAPISVDGQISATRDISVTTSSGSATTSGALTAGRNISVTANGVGIGNASAGGDLTVAAGSGALASGTLSAGDDITLGGAALTLGALTATGLGADSEGDGSNIRLTGAAVSSGRLQAASDIIVTASGAASLGLGGGGGVIAGRDVRLAGASLATGPLVQGRDLALSSGGALTTGDLTSTAGLVLAANGALITGNVRAAGDVGLAGSSISAGAIASDGAATVTTTGALAAGVITSTSATLTGGAVTLAGITARDNIRITGTSIGGALLLGGTDITLTASGDIAPLGTIAARRDLAIRGGNRIAYTDLSAGRDLSLTAPVIAGGRAFASRDLTIIATGSVTGTRFEAGRNLLIDPDQPIIADTVIAAGDATLIGASITVQTLDVGGRAALSATAGGISIDAARVTGSAQMVATGRITLGDWRSAALALLSGDLDVRRSLVAASLRVETPGPMVLGGNATGNGFRLAAADIARLRIGGAAEFFAGTTGAITAAVLPGQQPRSVAAAAGGTLTLEGFSYDPGALPVLNLYAGRGFDVNVTGRVAPTLNGGVIRIGDLAVDSLWRPGAILISGGFGSAELAVNCFGDVIAVNSLILLAVNDVVFGSAEFASAVRATAPDAIDVGAGVPGVTGPADNRLFAVAAQLRVDAGSRVVSQNSTAVAGGYVGLLIGGEGAPGSNGIVQINGARRVDLTGSLVLPNGDLRSGPNVALITGLNGGNSAGSFSFNGCAVGAPACGGGGTTPAEILRVEDYVVPTPGLLVPPAPSVTVLGIDNQLNGTAPVAIGTGDGTIVIQRRTTP